MRTKKLTILIDRVPLSATAIGCALLVLSAATWLGFVAARGKNGVQSPAKPSTTPAPAVPSRDADRALVVPESVLTVTLADELFPQAKPVTPASQSRLTLQLVAITGEGEHRRVFVRDPQADVYYDLAIGEPASPGVTLSEISDTAAVFLVSGSPVTLELPK